MLGLIFSYELDWGSYIIPIAKTLSKKIGALICSMKFLFPEVALHLYKSTICACMKYYCHVWAGAPRCFWELLDKLRKWICRTVAPSLAASLETLTHCKNVAFIGITLIDVHLNRLSSWGRYTRYSDRLHDSSVSIPRGYKDVYVDRFFPCTAWLWNCVPIECFPLTYDLSGFKSRINRHLLTAGSF